MMVVVAEKGVDNNGDTSVSSLVQEVAFVLRGEQWKNELFIQSMDMRESLILSSSSPSLVPIDSF